jgi:hypothetical protein
VKRSTVSGGGYTEVAGSPTTESTFSDTTVDNGETYYYVVSAYNSGGEGDESDEVSVTLQYVLPFNEDFESLGEGDLDGQRQWTSTNTVVQTNLAQGIKAASITSEDGYASHAFAGNETNVWADMEIQPVFAPEAPTGLGTNMASVLYFNTNGNPVAYNGTNAVVVSNVTISTGEWVRVTLHSDYVLKTWDLYINSALVVTNLGFYNEARTHSSELVVQGGSASQYATLDNIQIDTVSPLGAFYSLTVQSLYGIANPSGVSQILSDSVVHASISGSPVTFGTTQYVYTGWVRQGCEPGSGSETNTSFAITNDTTLTWQWSTNYWIEFNTVGE